VAHFKTQRVAYKKTGTEWEILGDLGARLHHKEDAKEAYTRCLEQKFSAKAWMRLLEIYADEGDLQRGLNAAFRIACYQWRWYMESTVCTTFIFSVGRDSNRRFVIVPDGGGAAPVQARADARARKTIVHADEHGAPGRRPGDHAGISELWAHVQARGVGLLMYLDLAQHRSHWQIAYFIQLDCYTCEHELLIKFIQVPWLLLGE
jgi:hypothetical protein